MTSTKNDSVDGVPEGYRPNVGIMLLDKTNRVFVARRLDTKDAWQMPQGGIDPDENPRHAVLREMKEEIGTDDAEIIAETKGWHCYDLPPDLARKLWHGRYRGQAQKWFALRFRGSDEAIDLGTHQPEFDAWRWVAANDLPDLIVPFKRRIYMDVLTEFAALFAR
jgi:putative (di)nucleoside polyphosphate hydrolase